jgi:hypothetical protein
MKFILKRKDRERSIRKDGGRENTKQGGRMYSNLGRKK